MLPKVTITEVAQKAGCSTGTVSAVINGRLSVKPSTRETVLSAIKELNFRPVGRAKNLKAKDSTRSIGLVIREMENPFYTDIALGVKEYADANGYIVLLSSSEGRHQQEELIVDLLSRKDISGAIIAPVLDGSSEIEHLFKLKMLNFPFVLLEEVKGIKANVVSIDNISATKKVVKYLVNSGYDRIIHFSGPSHASHTYERIDGFRRAFSESRLVYDESLIICVGAHFNDGFNKGLEYFKSLDRSQYPMAVVCYNDLVALGLLSALCQLNINVPDEVAIVGNDDIDFAKHCVKPLTTISTPRRELGRKAAEILIRNIESNDSRDLSMVVLDTEIVVRQSTKLLK
jgi:DNA-binding LacI/PurR family transcriptional regulator